MNVTKLDNIFNDIELFFFEKCVKNLEETKEENSLDGSKLLVTGRRISEELGRIGCFIEIKQIPQSIIDKLNIISQNTLKEECQLSHIIYVEYNKKYGEPSLPPHLDGDNSDLIINFQLSSNTTWDVGLDFDLYRLEDNSALLFNGNRNIHWRPIKNFNNNEYVRMIFFRFFKVNNRTDYSYLPMNPDHEMFKDAVNFRKTIN